MPDIYDQHDKTFASVSAFVIMAEGLTAERVATVAIKFPRDGAGRLIADVHILGAKMSRGFASGGGYDKRNAAVEQAINKINNVDCDDINARIALFKKAIKSAAWNEWTRSLESVGFKVYQAV